MPCGVLVVDSDRRIRAINKLMEKTFGVERARVMNMRGGEALRCVHSDTSPEGCGYAPECSECQVRQSALTAIAGNNIFRNKAELKLMTSGDSSRDYTILISAAPVEHQGERLAIVILEDITELNTLRKRLKTEHCFSGIIGRNADMNEVFDTIQAVADTDAPVLIQGESGTGKELVASAIHNEGPRSKNPFVPINCGALPEGLVESELFGHVKGAFTGALKDKKGRFKLADGGTLFLDEVAELPKSAQAKLLRVLQENKFERVGGEKTISVDVRIVSATNKNLKDEVKKGEFREDLFYRLNVVPVNIPPLRKRKDDIPLLLEYFLDMTEKNGQASDGFSMEAMSLMIDYPWPGNVRELQSALRFAMIKAGCGLIGPDDLPIELREFGMQRALRGPNRKLNVEGVKSALIESGGNKVKAARILGVGRATLYRFLAEHPDVS